MVYIIIVFILFIHLPSGQSFTSINAHSNEPCAQGENIGLIYQKANILTHLQRRYFF